MKQITHISRMDTLGGIERLLQSFINVPDPDLSHALLLTGKKINPVLRPADTSIPIRYSRRAAGVRLPSFLRSAHRNRTLTNLNPNVISFWGYPTTDHDHMTFPAQAKLVYQEHGSCWDMDVTARKQAFLNRMDAITCCSHAAQRMLQLRWNCTAPIHMVRNPVSPHARQDNMLPKTFPANRPLILGTAGRLVPYKATCIALLTLEKLLADGVDCHLNIVGTGPLRIPLEKKAAQLNISRHVTFINATADMRTFYRSLDLFLLPSIREPLGLVAIEAMAAGCPVICSSVDGIPEAVRDGETGYCIQPTLSIDDYVRDAGSDFSGKFPETVYDPGSDQLQAPLITDPQNIKDVIQRLLDQPALFEDMSRSAIQIAQTEFSFTQYFQTLKTVLLK